MTENMARQSKAQMALYIPRLLHFGSDAGLPVLDLQITPAPAPTLTLLRTITTVTLGHRFLDNTLYVDFSAIYGHDGRGCSSPFPQL